MGIRSVLLRTSRRRRENLAGYWGPGKESTTDLLSYAAVSPFNPSFYMQSRRGFVFSFFKNCMIAYEFGIGGGDGVGEERKENGTDQTPFYVFARPWLASPDNFFPREHQHRYQYPSSKEINIQKNYPLLPTPPPYASYSPSPFPFPSSSA